MVNNKNYKYMKLKELNVVSVILKSIKGYPGFGYSIIVDSWLYKPIKKWHCRSGCSLYFFTNNIMFCENSLSQIIYTFCYIIIPPGIKVSKILNKWVLFK